MKGVTARRYLAERLPGRLTPLLDGENAVGPEHEKVLSAVDPIRENKGFATTRVDS